MRAVEKDEDWALVSPKDGAVMRKVSARALWIRILTARVETGEPYIIYIDHVNRALPEHQQLQGLKVKTRSAEHTSELQSLMRISYAVFCLNKKNIVHGSNYIVEFYRAYGFIFD